VQPDSLGIDNARSLFL